MSSAYETPALLRVLGVLRRRWWVIALVAAACVGGAIAVSSRQHKEYEATAKLLFRPDGFSNVLFGSSLVQQSADPARDANTDTQLTVSPQVAAAVKRTLNLPDSVADLTGEVSASSESDADIVDVTVKDRSPTRAASIANAFVSQFIELRQREDRNKVGDAIADVRRQLAGLPPGDTAERQQITNQILPKLVALQSLQFGNAQVAGIATVPGSPVSPKPKRDAVIALLLGLILGGGLVLLLDAVDRRVKSIEEFEYLYGTPAIAAVPQTAFGSVRAGSVKPQTIEAFRMVRNGLEALVPRDRTSVIAVTSAVSGEGKTTVAINLARVLAAGGARVTVVEADLRRPTMAKHVPLVGDTSLGLTSVLVGARSARELLIPDDPALLTLRILPSGPITAGAGEMLRSDEMRDVLRELASNTDYVIVDAPPLLAVADTLPLVTLPEVDLMLVIARSYHTKREEARRTRALLEQHHVSRYAVVITGVSDVPGYDYSYAAAANGRQRRRRERQRVSS